MYRRLRRRPVARGAECSPLTAGSERLLPPRGSGAMDLAYVCEWEKKPKSNHCPSIPLVCAWSCRNLIAFTTDLRNEEEKGTARPCPAGWPPRRAHRPFGQGPPAETAGLGGLGSALAPESLTRTKKHKKLALFLPFNGCFFTGERFSLCSIRAALCWCRCLTSAAKHGCQLSSPKCFTMSILSLPLQQPGRCGFKTSCGFTQDSDSLLSWCRSHPYGPHHRHGAPVGRLLC